MAHGGAPNPQIQHRTQAAPPGDPRAQLDEGLKLIWRASNCREAEILQLRHQDAEKDRRIAHLKVSLYEANTHLGGAMEQNAMLLKRWDARCAMLKRWGLLNLEDGGVGKEEGFSKLLAEIAGLKESLIADGNNEEDGGVGKVEGFSKLLAEIAGLKESLIADGNNQEESEPSPIQEAEIRNVLRAAPMKEKDFVNIFRPRLISQKAKWAFAKSLQRLIEMRKIGGQKFLVLRDETDRTIRVPPISSDP